MITVWNGIDVLWVEAPCTVLFTGKCTALLLGNQYSTVYSLASWTVSLWRNILTMCWFLICLPFSSTEMILQCTIHLLCWWIFECLKQWMLCMFICSFINLNTKCLWSKEINVKAFPVQPPDNRYEYQFCFSEMYEEKSLNNRNFILKCMEKYSQ